MVDAHHADLRLYAAEFRRGELPSGIATSEQTRVTYADGETLLLAP